MPQSTEEAATGFLDAAFNLHRELGPGLLESVYEACVCHELTLMGVPFQRQISVPVSYRGFQIESGLRLDLLVADEVVVELKSIDALLPIHEAQLLTYLKITKKRVGILVNFNVPLLKQGIKRIAL
ncbi:MAG: GxxExxY protein [Planctomycetaceae bacterium]|nr:GxxExxY protein [Planctomycetaceae bacterium]